LTLDCGGMFRAAGIAWMGASVSPERLQRLVDELGVGLSAQGFAHERRAFLPHITLARRCRRPGDFTLAVPIRWTVARIALYASELASAGPWYRELAGWPLGGCAAAD
jgi:2'-5' RNA ligase